MKEEDYLRLHLLLAKPNHGEWWFDGLACYVFALSMCFFNLTILSDGKMCTPICNFLRINLSSIMLLLCASHACYPRSELPSKWWKFMEICIIKFKLLEVCLLSTFLIFYHCTIFLLCYICFLAEFFSP